MRATFGKKIKFVGSTVDETLFGERTKSREPFRVPEFEPPWIDNGKNKSSSSKPLLFYCPTSSDRPSSCRSQAKKGSPLLSANKPVKFAPSYADDTLFGKRRTKRSDSPPPSDFEPPWVKQSKGKSVRPLLFDCNPRLVFDNSFDESAFNSTVVPSSSTRQSSRCSSGTTSRARSVGNLSKPGYKPPWR